MKTDTENYIKKTQKQPIPSELISGVKLLKKKGLALDLGCGPGNFSKYLIDKKFIVVAIDIAESAIKSTKEKAGGFPIMAIQADLNTFPIVGNYNFVLAFKSIPFLNKGNDILRYREIAKSIVKGGVFVFSVFGKEDGWVKSGEVQGITLNKLKAIFKEFEFSSVSEKKFHKASVLGEMKDWHFIQGVAQKN
jgi:SAM-dependent methyltransferase